MLIVMVLSVSSCGQDEAPSGGQGPAVASAREQLIAGALLSPEFKQACDATVSCADPPRFDAPAAETVWRVFVVREPSGTIRIDRIDAIQVPEDDGVPIGPLSGSHLLVGLDGSSKPVDGQLIQFPDVMRVEYQPAGPAPDAGAQPGPGAAKVQPRRFEEVALGDKEVGTIGFVRASAEIKALAVQDESGSRVAEQDVQVATAQLQPDIGSFFMDSAWAQSGQSPTWPYEGNIPPYCAHVIILEGEMDRALAQDIAYEDEIIELVTPGPNQRAVIFAALRRMTPLLCQGVRRVALGVVPASVGIAGAVRTRSTGDMMLINVADAYSESSLRVSYYRRVQMMGTIIHEAAHSTDALINVQGSSPEGFGGDWILPARTMASRTIDRVRLEKGLRNEWFRLHQSFLQLNWAQPHQTSGEAKEAVYGWSPTQINDGGFMSHYGATSLHDDIAEMVEWAYVTDIYLAQGWTGQWSGDFACREMREHHSRDLPSRFTAVYTKLNFLKDLGMVAEEDVETCMGPDIGLPADAGGFHFWHDGNMLRSFDRSLTAKIGTNSQGLWVFEMQAEGEASFAQEMYPAKLELRIGLDPPGVPVHRVAWPRGVYKLGLRGNNAVRLRLDGASAGDFDVKDGYVLVAEASNERIAGSIFITVGMRFGAPLAVPQTWTPPLLIRFRIEH